MTCLWRRSALLSLAILHAWVAQAQAPAALRGQVLDAVTGAPVRGARISLGGLPTGTFTRTDASGRFELPVQDSSVMLSVVKAGFVRQTLPNVMTATPLEIRLPRGAVLTVFVLDMAGGPAAGAAVNVRCDAQSRGVRTDDRGQARLGGLPAGRCEVGPGLAPLVLFRGQPSIAELRAAHEEMVQRLPARRNALQQNAAVVELHAGEETAIALLDTGPAAPVADVTVVGARTRNATARGSGSMRGRVLAPDGRPAAGARVELDAGCPVPSTSCPGGLAVADASGAYAFTGLPPGRYRVRTSHPPLYPARELGHTPGAATGTVIALTEGQQLDGMDITLFVGGFVTGTIFDEYGEPAEEAFVQIVHADGPQGPTAGSLSRTDDRGQYRSQALVPGAYRVSVSLSPPGSADATVFYPGVLMTSEAIPVRVIAGGEAAGIDVIVSASIGVRLTGRVITSTGAPGAGTVTLSQRSGAAGTPRTAPLDSRGTFEFANVMPGEYEVSATTLPSPFAVVTRRRGEPVEAPPIPSGEHGRATVSVGTVAASVSITVEPRPSVP